MLFFGFNDRKKLVFENSSDYGIGLEGLYEFWGIFCSNFLIWKARKVFFIEKYFIE